MQPASRLPSEGRTRTSRLILAGAILSAGGYGLLAIANVSVAGAYGSGSLGGIALAYRMAALGDGLVGAGLLLVFLGIARLVRR